MAISVKTPVVLFVVAAVLVLAGAGIFVLLSSDSEAPAVAGGLAPSGQRLAATPGPGSSEPRPAGGLSDLAERTSTGPAASDDRCTVAWPVIVSLELVRAAHLPTARDAAPMGSGRRAAMRGVILDARANGVAAEITFIAGPNKDRVLRCNGAGEFGASDLYPGLGVVEVRAPGTPGSVREVRLRQQKTEHLNISYSLPGSVVGTVYDAQGEPLEGVEVMVDGQRNVTNEAGDFHYTSITAGLNMALVLRKPGYAHYGGVIAIPAGRHVEKGRYKFAMDVESTLRISIPDRIGGPDTTKVIVLPSNTRVTRTYPWYLVNPVEIPPGGSVKLTSLPRTKVIVRAFHEGAAAVPPQRAVTLGPGSDAHVELKFQPAPTVTGQVVDANGQAVRGARVSIEAPDRVAATTFHLGQMPMFLESEVIPTLPPAAQECVADERGRFLFSTWGEVSPVRYVVAENPEGTLWGSAIVRSGGDAADQEVLIELAPVAQGRADLRVDFPGRHQGVPVEVIVNGAPREPGIVPVEDVLHVEDLAEGTWRLHVSWNGEFVFGRDGYDEFILGPSGELRTVTLPQGAIDGQDEDTLLRAGKL